MFLRFAPLPLSLAFTFLYGCASSSYTDNGANPFDESVRRPQEVYAPRTDADAPKPSTPVQHLNAAQSAVTYAAPATSSAISVPVIEARPIEVGQPSPGTSPRVQEMLVEASRLGVLGDLQGKASVLEQAGYSGSAQAFYDLARMYLDGSFPSDIGEAHRYITHSHDAGYPEATRVLGMLYLRGQGVPANEDYGRKLLEKASKDSPRAAREYGMLLTNQAAPHLNNQTLGLEYLRDAAQRGDADASKALSRLQLSSGHSNEAAYSLAVTPAKQQPTETSNESDRALSQAKSGNTTAMLAFAQKLMLGQVKDPESEFTAYCWLSVAEKIGSVEAAQELYFIRGVRTISERDNPGRMDQCISDLHYEVSGH
jgi:TPR repeat protein